MAREFQGEGIPLDQAGLQEALDRLDVTAPQLWAVITVETRGCGFLAERRPTILFERHVFGRETRHRFDNTHPDISSRQRGGYRLGAAEYARLERAVALDRRAALRSTSWGLGQVMGFNAVAAGYPDVDAMVAAMCASETNQLLAMAGEILGSRLDAALRARDWAKFAAGYNGPAYRDNAYDTRLAAAHAKFTVGPLPDLDIRAAQVYLTYLGFTPGPIDGVMGRFTRSALQEFQIAHHLPRATAIDALTLARMRAEVGGSAALGVG